VQRILYIASGLDDACHPEERSDDEVLRSQIILNDPAKEEGSNACRQSTNGDRCGIGGGTVWTYTTTIFFLLFCSVKLSAISQYMQNLFLSALFQAL